MRILPNLELHVAHSCNLTCESCSHYSNQGHKGLVSLDDADAWMAAWSRRLAPKVFSLLGGEPTIHPKLAEFVTLARWHWPRTRLRLVTNGFFLHRHPSLPAVLAADPDAVLYLSIHHESPTYLDKLRPDLELLEGWQRQYGVKVKYYLSARHWTRRYQGFGAAMEPFDDKRPRQSWEQCPAKNFPQLHEGRIWKCSQLAYLGMQNARYGLSERWQPYLAYAPLEPDCTDSELNAFFDREEEPYCGMCPAEPEHFGMPLPLRVSHTDP